MTTRLRRAAPRWALAVATGALALVAVACQKRRDPADLEVPAPPPPAPPLPVDRALPGELAEGPEKAFGLTLPRVVAVRARFTDLVVGSADVSSDRVANYVRARVSAEKVDTGPAKTVFSHAIVRGHPGIELAIEVLAHGGSTEIQVRNLPMTQAPPGLTDEERWRAAGFKADGTLIDPKHLH